ncbi:MAG TPA: VOC family protein [Anaerolineae bacterium]|nr:VOC family protein [Anaerolineae bacterium]
MIREFDHVGVVVKDTRETAERFSSLFGFEVGECEEFPEKGFKSTFISKEKVTIELIEPLGTAGTIQRFVQKRGYGLHHISLRVDDIEQEIEVLESMGAKPLSSKPTRMTDTTEIAFLDPSSTAGILMELMCRTAGQA